MEARLGYVDEDLRLARACQSNREGPAIPAPRVAISAERGIRALAYSLSSWIQSFHGIEEMPMLIL